MTQPLNDRKVELRSNCGISGSPSCERGLASAGSVPEELGGTLEVQNVNDVSSAVDAAEPADVSDAVAAATFAEDDASEGDSLFDDGVLEQQ